MKINFSNFQIPYNDFLIRIGYTKNAKLSDPHMQILVLESFELAKKLVRPKVAAVFSDITVSENLIAFKSGYKIESFQVAKLLQGCFRVYGLAVTIGTDLEKKRNDLISKKETLQAFLLDAAGSVAAEEAISSASVQIKEYETNNNNITTKRFSPGYGDWILESQKEFLEWVGASGIGISLSSSSQMFPEKSVSAIIGVKKWTDKNF